jgi:hypothetical protein
MEDVVYILCPFGILYSHLVYFMVIWYIFTVLVCCNKKNLATLLSLTCKSLQCGTAPLCLKHQAPSFSS